MTSPQLFIGVVSYSRTIFPVSQGGNGLGSQLAQELNEQHGVLALLRVNTADLSSSQVTSDRATVQRALSAELRAEARYSRYLSRPARAKHAIRMAARWTKRIQHVIQSPSPASITRLLNIEASHLDLMKRGLDSGAAYVLILEDDAFCDHVGDLARGLVGFIHGADTPSFVNLSTSFSITELGVGHLLRGGDQSCSWQGSDNRSVFIGEKPITNTVCAIAYSRNFLVQLVAELDSLPEDPVLPIDWKLNVALMNLFDSNRMTESKCWWIEPAPIKQMSMLQ